MKNELKDLKATITEAGAFGASMWNQIEAILCLCQH